MDTLGINAMEKDVLKLQVDLMKRQVALDRMPVSQTVKEWV